MQQFETLQQLYQWRLSWFGLCLQLAESFSTNSSSWKMVAESFLVTSTQLAGSVWMPVLPNSVFIFRCNISMEISKL